VGPLLLQIELVRMRGLEPPRCHHHRLLRPARLPVPPHPHGQFIMRTGRKGVKKASSWPRWRLANRLRLAISDNATAISQGAIAPNVVRIAIPQTIPPNNVSEAVAARSASVPAAVAGIMAIYKFATLLTVVRQVGTSVSPVSVRAATLNPI
jgi:hypothetical protein